MKPAIITLVATLALSGCAELSKVIGNLPFKLPTVAEFCAMSPETKKAVLKTFGQKAVYLEAACDLVGGSVK